MSTQLRLGDIVVDVVRKDIKNLHLSVHPPTGQVRISAPARMKQDAIRVFALSKLDWIMRQQKKLLSQDRETPREYLDRESHYVWGKRYLLRVLEADLPPSIEMDHSRLVLRVRPGTETDRRQMIVEAWYRDQLKQAVPALLAKWEPILGETVTKVFVQRMKTKWGSCNPTSASIRLNTDLARKPRECLEYVVVHEMAHLIAPTHGANFTTLMDRLMPQWRSQRDRLNQLPVPHQK